MTVTNHLLDILFKPHCLVCGIEVVSHQNRLCEACDPDFPRKLRDGLRSRYDNTPRLSSEELCLICDEPAAFESDCCLACHLSPPNFDELISFWRYTERVEKLIHAIKYKDAFPLIPQIAQRAYRLLQNSKFKHSKWDLVVPAPSSEAAIAKRGYQHMSLFARHLGRHLKTPVKPLTLKIVGQSFQPQALKPIGQRAKNISGRISLGPLPVDGLKILLVDDVATTTASINEAAKVLKEHGAKSVSVLTLARSTQFTECRLLAQSAISEPQLGNLRAIA